MLPFIEQLWIDDMQMVHKCVEVGVFVLRSACPQVCLMWCCQYTLFEIVDVVLDFCFVELYRREHVVGEHMLVAAFGLG